MANFLVGGGNKVSVKVSTIPAGTNNPAVGGNTQIMGGTQSGFSISADLTESTVFEDALGYSQGVITSQSWEVPWTANIMAGDAGHAIVKSAAENGVAGEQIGITVTVTSDGSTIISKLDGVAVVTNYSEDYPADGILTYNCTFTGVGTPVLS